MASLSGVCRSVRFVEELGFSDFGEALAAVGSALSAVEQSGDGEYWKLLPEDALDLGREMEKLGRLVHAAQVRATAELDTGNVAAARGCSGGGVAAAGVQHIPGRGQRPSEYSPEDIAAGVDDRPTLPPVLPLVGASVSAGELSSEHIKIVVDTMGKLPHKLSVEVCDFWESFLVEKATLLDPKVLEKVARKVLDAADPDGTMDDTTPAAKMEFLFGSRNIRTGLSPVKVQLDDHGVEVVKKAIDALAAPRPESGGVKDLRPPANRNAHALVAAMRGFLDARTGPAQGGERPHLTIVMNWDLVPGRSRKRHSTLADL